MFTLRHFAVVGQKRGNLVPTRSCLSSARHRVSDHKKPSSIHHPDHKRSFSLYNQSTTPVGLYCTTTQIKCAAPATIDARPSKPCQASPQPGTCLALSCRNMSHPASQPSSQALSPEVRELLNEIAFQKVLLNSLNDTVENREEAEREISAEIKTLEKQLRHLKRCTTSTASNCTPSASQFFSQATPSNSTTTKPAAMESNHSRPPGNTPQGMLGTLPTFPTLARKV